MSYRLTIRKEAEADIREAYQYYESCRMGLGREFLLCMEACLAVVRRNPQAFRVVHKNVVRHMVHRFPYGVYFIVKGEFVIVFAVMHARRDPRQWQSRS